MKHLSFLIKPSSSKCNLNCKYCFYHDVSDNRMVQDYGFMTEKTTLNIIQKSLIDADGGQITFAFQGGEPTLMGLDYYESFIDSVNQYNLKNSKINYAIQTNGIVIDENWASFFKKNNVLVGLSLDGPKDIHDLNRLDKKGDGTYKSAIAASKVLDEYDVDYNLLIVVTSLVARKIDKVYNFFKSKGYKYLQFIPCIDPIENEKTKYSLSTEQYKEFLCKLFDKWYNDIVNGNIISIRYFDNIMAMFLGMPPESCDMVGKCSIQNVIEADGSLYPCDFYVLDEVKLGNLNTDTLTSVQESSIAKSFVMESIKLNEKCTSCDWLKLCRGGCKRQRILEDDGSYGVNRFCDAYKSFFEYTHIRFESLARTISKRNIK